MAARVRVRTAGAALAVGALLTAGCAADAEPMSPAAATDETPSSSSAAPSPTPSPTPSSSAAPSSSPGTASATPAPPPAPSAEPSAEAPPAPDGDALRDRLLPAAAFGDDATVVALTREQLGAAGSGWGGWGGGWPGPWYGGDGDRPSDRGGDVTVEPAACRDAVDGLPAFDGDAGALAAQAARTPQTQTVQVLAESPDVAALRLPVDELVAACSTVTARSAWGWTTTVEVRPLEVPQLGQQSGGVQVTVDAAGEDSVRVLVGFVVDGSRGLLLAQSAAPDEAAPDPAAFAALLTEAAQAAAG